MNNNAGAATAAVAATPSGHAAGRGHTLAGAGLLIFFGTLAYLSSFRGVFLFDDDTIIVANHHLQTLWPPMRSMFCREFAMRPLVGFSFALNYALGGHNPWGYHAVNLGIHLCAGLTLFGLLRRTLLTPPMRERFAAASGTVALIIALLWLIHPLQTQAVTYIVQRSEALMGLFFFLTLYCSLRGFDSRHGSLWSLFAVLAAGLGMASKQVMAGAPLLVLLHDRTFLSGSFLAALRARRGLYAGLAGSWVLLAALLAAAPASTSAGFGLPDLPPLQYALSQFGVIAHYLRLSFWPQSLVLDYQWAAASSAAEIVPPALLIAALFVATLILLRRKSTWGFIGAWFFVTLAPTSSIMPIADLAFEHRMYLALAAVICAVIGAVYWLGEKLIERTGWQRLPLIAVPVAAGCAFLLGSLTADRNRDYHSAVRMWSDTAAKVPGNFRARIFLGCALIGERRADEALAQFEVALRMRPNSPVALVNIGNVLRDKGQAARAQEMYLQAIAANPNMAEAHCNLANSYGDLGQVDNALKHYAAAIRANPDYLPAHYSLGTLLMEQKQFTAAQQSLRTAIRLGPRFAAAHYYLGRCLQQQGDKAGAASAFREALTLQPDMAAARAALEELSRR